jgi:hypothetical protein
MWKSNPGLPARTLVLDDYVNLIELLCHYKPFKDGTRLNEEFSPYLKQNTTLHHYKDQLVNDVYSGNHTKPTIQNTALTYC